MNQIKIKGTFLDEISHDIPDQNWSEKECDVCKDQNLDEGSFFPPSHLGRSFPGLLSFQISTRGSTQKS